MATMKLLLFALLTCITSAQLLGRHLIDADPELFTHRKMKVPANAPVVADEYIVEFVEGFDPSDKDERLIPFGKIKKALKLLNGVVLTNPSRRLLKKLQNSPAVLSIEPNLIVVVNQLGTVPLSPNVFGLEVWGLDRIDQVSGTNGDYTYDSDGSGVDIYVVDTGIRGSHEVFRTVPTDPSSTRVSCFHSTWNDDCYDWNGHGTRCSALAGGIGIGPATGASIKSVKVMDASGTGNVGDIVAGLDAIKDAATQSGAPATVVSMSIALSSIFAPEYMTSLDEAVNRLTAAGITVVVAAGNDGTDACTSSPAHSDAIAVGAINKFQSKPSWSNYGDCVNLYAPGASAFWSATSTDDSAFNKGAGTSFSCPLVAGAAAVILQNSSCLDHFAVAAEIDSRVSYDTISGLEGLTKVLNTRPGTTYPVCAAPSPPTTAPVAPTATPIAPTATPVAPTATPITPTATPVTPTTAPIAPTATPVAPTATPIAPTPAPVAPTATPIAPTATPVAPTATPIAPTATPIAPTATPIAPTATPVAPTPDPVAPTPAPQPTCGQRNAFCTRSDQCCSGRCRRSRNKCR